MCRVSSVLNRDYKTFGKQNMIDGSEETCWNSESGDSQWINLVFDVPLCVVRVKVTFQGGFVGREMSLMNDKQEVVGFFYPEDKNTTQIFDLNAPTLTSSLKVLFKGSTDFFGRITVYDFDVVGTNAQ